MEREILFRGKRKDNGEWVYGNINYLYDGVFILETCYCGNIEAPDYNPQAMGCGLEDNNIIDGYDAMEYGWHEAIERQGELLPCFVEVIPETIGQFIEYFDTTGKEIFDGDLVKFEKFDYLHVIIYNDINKCFSCIPLWEYKQMQEDELSKRNILYNRGNIKASFFEEYKPYVVGNIHDNPELLK